MNENHLNVRKNKIKQNEMKMKKKEKKRNKNNIMCVNKNSCMFMVYGEKRIIFKFFFFLI